MTVSYYNMNTVHQRVEVSQISPGLNCRTQIG